jgi:hypothetical protein
MAYGRLDVFWPDGEFESYMLKNASVSIGRSAGCSIVLDTDTISRYHTSITHEGGEVKIADMDSANGTFVDGTRLESNESRRLLGGEEIQIGHLRMIYHNTEEQPTVPLTRIAEDTQRIEREDLGFSIDVYGPEIAVPPGSHTSMEIAIHNKLDKRQRFTVQVTGLPDGWARINRPEIQVDAEDIGSVLVNIKPFRISDSKPGDYPVQVTVALKDAPEKKLEADINVRILPYSGFGMALATRRLSAYDNFRLHLHNQGSIGLPLYVMGRSRDDTLRFGIAQSNILLAPGQRLVLQGVITPRRRRLFGGPQEHAFDLLVRSRDEAAFLAAERGYFTETAILPRWAAAAVGVLGVVVMILLVAALALILVGAPPEPEVVAFQAGSQRVQRGELLQLTWQVNNTENANILIDGEPIITNIPPGTNSAEISTGDYTGEILVVLEAISGERSDRAELLIEVFQPLTVEVFEVTPPTLVRNVVQPLTIRWRVPGAATTRIDGLEGFSQVAIEPSYGEEGTLADIPGIASDGLTISLWAESETGETLQQTITVDLINPECTTIEDGYTLRDAPDSGSNVVSTVAQGVTLVIERRDESGAWLQARLNSGMKAWGLRQGLECAGTFNPGDLKIEPGTGPGPEITATPGDD